MKYFIETYGCQMNVHDSERMAGLLEQAGYDPAASDRDADIVVVNTCSVRERAEDKLYTRLGEIREMAREQRPQRAAVSRVPTAEQLDGVGVDHAGVGGTRWCARQESNLRPPV